MRSPFLPALSLLLLAGCSETTTRFPSLLPRSAESEGFAEPVRPAVVAIPDAALDARIATLSAQLDSANAGFTKAADEAEAKVSAARDAAQGSDAWLMAQQALSTLDGARGTTLSVVADLDRLAIERGAAGEPAYPALRTVLSRADQIAKAQEQRTTALQAVLPSG